MSKSKVGSKRIDENRISLFLPDRPDCEYILNVNNRDLRFIVCFDGEIPSGGLPKGSTIVFSHSLVSLQCHRDRVYKKRSDHEDPVLYDLNDEVASQIRYRYFILLQAGRAIFRMYKTDTLQPKYLIVDIGKTVEFSTSSY